MKDAFQEMYDRELDELAPVMDALAASNDAGFLAQAESERGFTIPSDASEEWIIQRARELACTAFKQWVYEVRGWGEPYEPLLLAPEHVWGVVPTSHLLRSRPVKTGNAGWQE